MFLILYESAIIVHASHIIIFLESCCNCNIINQKLLLHHGGLVGILDNGEIILDGHENLHTFLN